MHKRVLAQASRQVKKRTPLILDISDLKKKYAEKMEYLTTVRDGSEDGEFVDGCWTNQVITRGDDRDALNESLLK